MMSRTHLAIGISGALIYMKLTNDYNVREIIPGAILGSVIPDLDTAKSWAAQSIPFFDDKLRDFGILKHRGLTHGNIKDMKTKNKRLNAWFLFVAMIALMIGLYLEICNNDLFLGIIIGYISHMIVDMIAYLAKITCKTDNIIFRLTWIINMAIFFLIK
jgi:membrane-bound metal-dependent hydrolase YbcI (DUF457 family)